GERGRLLEQLLGARAGRDGVEHDADRLGELVEEGEVDVAEAIERGELDDRLDLALEDDRQHDDVDGLGLAEAGADTDVIAGHLAEEDPLLLEDALADEALADAELVGEVLALAVGVAGEQPQHAAVGVVHQIEDALLRRDKRGELLEDELADRLEVA